jgi:hypothetical protein
MSRHRRLALAGLAGLTLAGATAAYAGGALSGGVAPVEARGRPYQPAQTVGARQSQAFAILRGPRRAADALPAVAGRTIERGPGPELGVNPALARSAAGSGKGYYVVPGRGWVCLARTTGASSCNTTEKAIDGRVVGLSGRPGAGLQLDGLVPDGVGTVEVLGTNGERLAVPVTDNVWSAQPEFVPASVHWAGPASSADVPVFLAPPATG